MPRIEWLLRQQRAQQLAREYGLSFACPCGRRAGGVAPDGAICPECAKALYQLTLDAHRLLTKSTGPFQPWNKHTTEA
jgi:hypothetical protein